MSLCRKISSSIPRPTMYTVWQNFQELDQELADLEALTSQAGVPIIWVKRVHASCGIRMVAMGREEKITNLFGK